MIKYFIIQRYEKGKSYLPAPPVGYPCPDDGSILAHH
jgi:hypothetical protein